MGVLQSNKYPNLYVKVDHWGGTNPVDILAILESVIDEFMSVTDFGNYSWKIVVVSNSEEEPNKAICPMYYQKEKHDDIFLHVKGNLWCQYAYQFAHEFCHHLIASTSTAIVKFGWLEESICELASLFIMQRMSDTWSKKPPYPHWKEYAPEFAKYSLERQSSKKVNSEDFAEWYLANIEDLYKERYNRDNNLEVACRLLGIFNAAPTIWNSIFQFNKVKFNEATSINEFMDSWKNLLDEKEKENFQEVQSALSL